MKDLDLTGFQPHPPARPWRMTQTWHNLLFAHYPVDPAALAPLVPGPLEVDTFAGVGWVGLVAFRLDHIRLHNLPEVPFVRGFAEINVRTYVRYGARRGVLFLSLDTDHLFTIAAARLWFQLPYQFAHVAFNESYGGVRFSSQRATPFAPPAAFAVTYHPCSDIFRSTAGSLEQWLTERYCYFAPALGALYRCDIRHRSWLLQKAQVSISNNTMFAAHGLPAPQTAPLLHYANYMKALIWPARWVAALSDAPGYAWGLMPAAV